MAEKTLIAKVTPDESDPDVLVVTSPVVGMADGAPPVGVYLNPFDRIIPVKILNQRYTLRMPRDTQGRVTEVLIPNSYTPIAYAQPLARIDPRALDAQATAAGAGGAASTSGGETADSGVLTITAPSDGIFYRRPAPDMPAYVEVGSAISSGGTLGLVEIMKCFHQITYGGPGLPEKGEVVEILAEDAAEVGFGDPLFRVKPTG